MTAFTGPEVLLADPKSGMVASMDEKNRIWLFSFWSTSRFKDDGDDKDSKTYHFHAQGKTQLRAFNRLQDA